MLTTPSLFLQEFSDDEAMTDADEQQQPLRDEMEALAGAADQEVEEQEAAERNAAGEGDESRMGSEDPADKSKRPSALPEGLNTGDVTPAETGTTPMPGSPPQTKPGESTFSEYGKSKLTISKSNSSAFHCYEKSRPVRFTELHLHCLRRSALNKIGDGAPSRSMANGLSLPNISGECTSYFRWP